jgi:hypothetical protein
LQLQISTLRYTLLITRSLRVATSELLYLSSCHPESVSLPPLSKRPRLDDSNSSNSMRMSQLIHSPIQDEHAWDSEIDMALINQGVLGKPHTASNRVGCWGSLGSQCTY